VLPPINLSGSYLTVVAAVSGTTISPYLFFWQASEEVEDEQEDPKAEPVIEAPQQAPRQMARMQPDTIVGWASPHLRTVHHADDGGDAERARCHRHSDLLPGGRGAALGGQAQRPGRARAFYSTIAVSTFVGAVLNFSPLDPIKALFWSAVINGVAAVPIMVMITLMASRRQVMGQFTLMPWLMSFGWLTRAAMAAAAIGLFAARGN